MALWSRRTATPPPEPEPPYRILNLKEEFPTPVSRQVDNFDSPQKYEVISGGAKDNFFFSGMRISCQDASNSTAFGLAEERIRKAVKDGVLPKEVTVIVQHVPDPEIYVGISKPRENAGERVFDVEMPSDILVQAYAGVPNPPADAGAAYGLMSDTVFDLLGRDNVITGLKAR